MLSFQGVGATTGKGSGVAVIHKKAVHNFHDKIYGIEAKELFYEIKEIAIAELESLYSNCEDCETKDIFLAHKLILDDPEVNDQIFKQIEEGLELSEAIKQVQTDYFKQFDSMDSEVFSSKALDIQDVFDRLLEKIKKQSKLKIINKNFVLVCDDLLPTTIYDYPLEYLKAILVKRGSMFAHGVIIAKAKQIPVVIGLGAECRRINNGDYLVVDGFSGKVVLISE